MMNFFSADKVNWSCKPSTIVAAKDGKPVIRSEGLFFSIEKRQLKTKSVYVLRLKSGISGERFEEKCATLAKAKQLAEK